MSIIDVLLKIHVLLLFLLSYVFVRFMIWFLWPPQISSAESINFNFVPFIGRGSWNPVCQNSFLRWNLLICVHWAIRNDRCAIAHMATLRFLHFLAPTVLDQFFSIRLVYLYSTCQCHVHANAHKLYLQQKPSPHFMFSRSPNRKWGIKSQAIAVWGRVPQF